MTIRFAASGEEGILSHLHHTIFSETKWEEAFWQESLSNPASLILMAEGPEGPCGLIALRQILDEAEILTLGVLATARGQGHAKALLMQAQSHSQKRGAAQLILEVAEDNRPAIGLYLQAGFEVVGHRKDYYGTGRSAQIMRWRSDLPRGGNAA